MSAPESKTCKTCGEAKPPSDFYAHRNTRDKLHPECKECVRARTIRNRWARIDEIREYDRWRYQTLPGRAEANIASARASYRADRERQLVLRRAYYLANPEVFERSRAKRKALLRGVEHQPYTRREIYDRDNGTCRRCTKALPYEPRGFQIDHIVPLALGGPDTPANVQLMCGPCNREKWMNLEGQIHLPV